MSDELNVQEHERSPVSMEQCPSLPGNMDTSLVYMYHPNTGIQNVIMEQNSDSQGLGIGENDNETQRTHIPPGHEISVEMSTQGRCGNDGPSIGGDPGTSQTFSITDTVSSDPADQDCSPIQTLDGVHIPNPTVERSLENSDSQDSSKHTVDIQDTDVNIHHNYTEPVSSTPIASCPSIPCSVAEVCNVYQSLFSQASGSILVQAETPGTDDAIDGIIQPINTQLIQGCIVANSEGKNSKITQYLILQDPENASPMTGTPVPVVEALQSSDSSCAPESMNMDDMETLEDMVEVVIVQQYKCKMCKYKSTSKSILLRHVKERHIQSASREEKKALEEKVARPREEAEEEEDDDIVDAGAIDNQNDDSDYSPGEDTPSGRNVESPPRIITKERPRRKPGRPRKIARIDGPKLNCTTDPICTNDSQTDQGITNSDLENKDPSSLQHPEEQNPPKRMRGRPPKYMRGKRYRRFRGSRFYRPPSKRLLRPFICRVCGSSFLTHEDFTFHVNSHVGNDPQAFKCQQCNYQCRRWSSLKEHMYNHEGNKPYKCEECSYTSVYKKDVLRHSAVHKEDRKKKADKASKPTIYPCPVCSRIYNMQKRLTQHMKIHSTEKPHMCDKCGKAFKKRYTFKMHLLTHLQCVGKSRYKCEFCEFICGDRKQLLNHQFTHMNDKPFKCNQCKYHTYRQDFLLSHMATKHAGGKPFACDYCHFTTKHKKNLRLHVQGRHALLFNEWSQRHPEEAPSRRRPFFSVQQIEDLKQQHQQSETQVQSIQQAEINPGDLAYQILEPSLQQQAEDQSQSTLGAATIIYEQGVEAEEYATQTALDLLLNMSTQREGTGGPLQVAVVKSGTGGKIQSSEIRAGETQMAQVLTLHMDGNEVTSVQEAGYEEAGIQGVGFEGTTVQQITIEEDFSAAEYSLINAENIQTSLCSETGSAQTLLEDSIQEKSMLQMEHKPQQVDLATGITTATPTVKKYCCKLCGSAFWGRSEMEIHKKAHVATGGFKCPDCTFIATSWPEVRNHMSVHSDRRPHRCDQCSFACRNKRDLSRHAMIHTNHRPHSCHLCGQRFTRKAHLKFHIKRLHQGKNEQQQNEGLISLMGEY
ncbi:hypothetical protein GDO86_014138 [Hymenochirus boettgeri]|uniref:C2H2-type domain-containing protein n=1 Tax=Hymenochirus boettgeri TaxID=247094 RepID=A0A8T2JT34_9PIPI|nr:hypothetical protein GDO86_014138 [Hymenochirus boettgeri]